MAAVSSRRLSEAHFVSLPSQSNVYGMSTLCADGAAKILVASLRRQVICVEYVSNKATDDDDETLVPASREVHFTYIPGGAEIIAIDSFNKSSGGASDFVVGITFSKPMDSPAALYFNVYTDWEPKAELGLDSIAQSCVSLKLSFVPYQLYHAEVWRDFLHGHSEIVWLLGGSDGEIHLYQEDKAQHTYCERNTHDFFPEFHGLKRIILWIDVTYCDGRTKRLSAIGGEDGFIQATVADVPTNEILSKWELRHDSPISCVKFFRVRTDLEWPKFLLEEGKSPVSSDTAAPDATFHLLVISTLEMAVIYWDVVSRGFDCQMLLPGSDEFDCVQCACVADIDMDGINEIIVGTYGQEMLVYKYDNGSFVQVWQRSFAYPLLSIDYLDVTGDGLRELAVLSTKGLHIFQHSLQWVADVVAQRLESLVQDVEKSRKQAIIQSK